MKLSLLLALSLSLSIVGCSDSSKESIDKLTNQAPEITLSQTTQKISSDQTEVTLSATATDDVGIVHTVWQQISGKVVELQNADTLNASFSVPVTTFEQDESKLVFGLTVTDTDNAQSTAEMIVIIEPNNRAPTIAIESPEQAYKGQQVSLKSNATDQDGEVISVIWEQLSGPMVTLVQAEQNATFSVPELSSTETARFKVTAIDNKGSDVYSIIEVKLYPVEQLVVTTESEVTASAGATVVIHWQSNGKNLNYSIAPEAGESVGNIELTENYAYFTAPKVQEESLLSLALKVTDEFGQKVVESINLTITPSSNLFAEKELIHEFFKGVEIYHAEFHDIDNDGFRDIVLWLNDGVFWFKSNGKNFADIDVTKRLIHSETDKNQDVNFFLDLNGDGKLDYLQGDGSLGVYFNQGVGFSQRIELGEILKVTYDWHEGKSPYETFYIEEQAYLIIGNNLDVRVYALNAKSVDLVESTMLPDPIMNNSLSVCNIEGKNNPSVFFRTLKREAGAGNKLSKLYQFKLFDSEPNVIATASISEASGACLSSSDFDFPAIFIDATRTWGYSGEEVVSAIQYSNANLEIIDVTEQFERGVSLPLKAVRVNDDGQLDLIDGDNRIGYIRKNQPGLSFFNRAYVERVGSDLFIDKVGVGVSYDIDIPDIRMHLLNLQPEVIPEINFQVGTEIVSVEPLGDYLKLVTKEPNSYSDFSYSMINFAGEKPIVDTADFSSFLTFDTSRFDSTFWSQTFNVDWNEDGKLDLISLMLPRETYDVGANNYQVTLALANNDEWFEPAKVLYETSSSFDYYKRFLKLENIINDNKPEVILFTDAPWVGNGFYYNLEVLTFDESIEQFDINPLVPVGIKNAPHYKELNNQYFDYNDDGLNDAFSYVIDNGFYEYDPCFENACDYQRQDFVVGYITVQEQIDDGFTEQVIFDSKKRALADLRQYDIDKDNKPDLLLDYFEMTENSIKPSEYEIGAAKQLWYKINADGGFNSLSMERYEFDGYLDVFDTSQSGYLFDMNYQKGELVEYDYSTVLKQPVIKQIIDTKTADYSNDEKFYLHDVDRDGDLDIIVYSKNQIYWNQNLAK